MKKNLFNSSVLIISLMLLLGACGSGTDASVVPGAADPRAVVKWTWVAGDYDGDVSGVYGTQGVAHPDNKPGGRWPAAMWTGKDGAIYIFGGRTGNSPITYVRNDFWKYDIAQDRWTWIAGSDVTGTRSTYGTKGVPAAANIPGAREQSAHWTGDDGSFWLFGGFGWPESGTYGLLNDLWRRDPVTNEWTWVSGGKAIAQAGVYGTKGTGHTDNTPGSRTSASYTTDRNGRFWLFGGWGFDSTGTLGRLNDLWCFDLASGNWIWIAGPNLRNTPGSYGSKGVAHIDNLPGSRTDSALWSDSSGNLWLFGGSISSSDFINDVWMFSPATGLWTWMTGSNLANQAAVYGTKGKTTASNTPGARDIAATWVDSLGQFWFFGGYGYTHTSSWDDLGELNDVWKFDPRTLRWTWMAGSSGIEQGGNYPERNKPSALASPGSRYEATGVRDASGRLWLFGGEGWYGPDGDWGYMNDLWRF